jgi:hypothetical protein
MTAIRNSSIEDGAREKEISAGGAPFVCLHRSLSVLLETPLSE